MNKKTLTRWLLVHNDTGTIDIINKEVSSYAPLNRILDEVGFYELEFFEVNQDKYFCTYESNEKNINKSKIHVGKRSGGELYDMSEEDFKNLPQMKKKFFERYNNTMN